MISFELGKEIEKNVFRLVTSLGQKKKSEFPWGTQVEPWSSNKENKECKFSSLGSVYEFQPLKLSRMFHLKKWDATNTSFSLKENYIYGQPICFNGVNLTVA